MKAFIGTKIILAESMTDLEFDLKFRGKNFEAGTASRQGYHVKYSNPDGSRYGSWSPKDVFERAYREVSDDEKELLNIEAVCLKMEK